VEVSSKITKNKLFPLFYIHIDYRCGTIPLHAELQVWDLKQGWDYPKQVRDYLTQMWDYLTQMWDYPKQVLDYLKQVLDYLKQGFAFTVMHPLIFQDSAKHISPLKWPFLNNFPRA